MAVTDKRVAIIARQKCRRIISPKKNKTRQKQKSDNLNDYLYDQSESEELNVSLLNYHKFSLIPHSI